MQSPLIWALLSARAGDNAQVLELARRVGGTVIEKQLAHTAWHLVPNVLRGASLNTLTPAARDLIAPPWPDLVIAAARRNAPAATAIRALSGGRTRLVHIGRPRMALGRFDLVITTPQYGLPGDENVITLSGPFARPRQMSVQILDEWRLLWRDLPRPWIMAAIGASKYPLRLSAREREAFAHALGRAAAETGASILLFDSPRSEAGALSHVAGFLKGKVWWDATRPAGSYQAALALADMFAVTGDSVSMATEMMQTGKPAAVHLLPRGFAPGWSGASGLGAVLARRGVLSPPRDVDHLMRVLIQRGPLGILGQSWGQGAGLAAEQDEAVARVRALLSVSSRA